MSNLLEVKKVTQLEDEEVIPQYIKVTSLSHFGFRGYIEEELNNNKFKCKIWPVKNSMDEKGRLMFDNPVEVILNYNSFKPLNNR